MTDVGTTGTSPGSARRSPPFGPREFRADTGKTRSPLRRSHPIQASTPGPSAYHRSEVQTTRGPRGSLSAVDLRPGERERAPCAPSQPTCTQAWQWRGWGGCTRRASAGASRRCQPLRLVAVPSERRVPPPPSSHPSFPREVFAGEMFYQPLSARRVGAGLTGPLHSHSPRVSPAVGACSPCQVSFPQFSVGFLRLPGSTPWTSVAHRPTEAALAPAARLSSALELPRGPAPARVCEISTL